MHYFGVRMSVTSTCACTARSLNASGNVFPSDHSAARSAKCVLSGEPDCPGALIAGRAIPVRGVEGHRDSIAGAPVAPARRTLKRRLRRIASRRAGARTGPLPRPAARARAEPAASASTQRGALQRSTSLAAMTRRGNLLQQLRRRGRDEAERSQQGLRRLALAPAAASRATAATTRSRAHPPIVPVQPGPASRRSSRAGTGTKLTISDARRSASTNVDRCAPASSSARARRRTRGRARAIERRGGELRRGARLAAGPADREREMTLEIGRDDDAVPRRLGREVHRRLAAAHGDEIGADVDVDPAALVLDLTRVRRVQLLDEDVLRIGVDRRRASSAMRSLCPSATPGRHGAVAPITFQPGALRWTK